MKARWNKKITGNTQIIYEDYVVDKHIGEKKNLVLLSIGSGICSHEMQFAKHSNFEKIICLDIAENLMNEAKVKACNLGLTQMEFMVEDIRKVQFEENQFDIVLFHSSLHHFSNIELLLRNKVSQWLKPKGHVIINEYVGKNRLQFDKEQIKWINKGLQIVPQRMKKRFKTNIIKNKYYGSGYLRMIVADPSECIESEQILPTLRKQFDVIEENLLEEISL